MVMKGEDLKEDTAEVVEAVTTVETMVQIIALVIVIKQRKRLLD